MKIGIDLGGTKIEGIILDSNAKVTEKIRVDTSGDDYQQIVDRVCEVVVKLQSIAGNQLSVGIGTPGALSISSELMKNCNSICLNGHPLKRDLEKQLGYEIKMENDANCFALAEAHFGAGAKVGTVFGVILGTGTGGGIVIDKKLLTGPNRIAGEWGHNAVPALILEMSAGNRRCYCGRRDCVETFLSGRGLTQTYLEMHGDELEAVEIAKRAEGGEKNASDSIDVYCVELAVCLSTVVNLVDPDMIVLGGGLSNIKRIYERVLDDMQTHVFTDIIKTRLSPPTFGDASGALGAACLWND